MPAKLFLNENGSCLQHHPKRMIAADIAAQSAVAATVAFNMVTIPRGEKLHSSSSSGSGSFSMTLLRSHWLTSVLLFSSSSSSLITECRQRACQITFLISFPFLFCCWNSKNKKFLSTNNMLEFLLHKIARPKRAKVPTRLTLYDQRKAAKLYLKKYNVLFFMDSFF